MAIHEVFLFFISRSVRASLEQYLSTTKLFCVTADFSLRLKLQEQQGKLQFRRRNDWIDSTPFTHPSHEVDIFYPKKCRAHFFVEIGLT